MPRLFLLRHAKSSWANPGMEDFDRPLNGRGVASVPLIARYMAEHDFQPDLVLCSSAQRTRETFAGLLPFLSHDFEVRFLEALYEPTDDSYIPALRRLGGSAKNLLLIGHNPTMQMTALDLAGDGEAEMVASVTLKYPTAALAVLDLPISDFADIRRRIGTLVDYVCPRDLGLSGD
ncbi:SixA phosphatase family protein [Oryzibacter oryziterrae]|uniref:SixA phosphatase family protein n=1 Tax=Oryzibacter oryziterrae TaxID=2766474 RepID=UPI001F252110|nr:histidine phosphatase family protein [Oryzibacter oryziterrae]